MKKSKESYDNPTGFTFGQLIIVVTIIVGIAFFLIAFLGKKPSKMTTAGMLPKITYKCLSKSPDGIPIKVIVTPPRGAFLYKSANIQSPSQKSLRFFEIFYVYQKQNDFYQVGTDPLSGKTIGWVKRSDVLKWPHKFALHLKQNLNRPPIYVWEQKKDIGSGNWKYIQRTDVEHYTPFPIFAVDGNYYKIAFIWQTGTLNSGVVQGWTSEIRLPDDADIFCYITKKELKVLMSQLLGIIKIIKDGPYFDHPTIKFFKDNLGITFGRDMNIETEMRAFIKQVSGDPSKLTSHLAKYPKRIRNRLRPRINVFIKVEEFYEDIHNWDKEGRGWIQKELLEELKHE